MTTVKVISNITFEELVNGALQLPPTDFDRFIKKIQTLRKEKTQKQPSQREQQLITQIKENLSLQELERLKTLEQKHATQTLNEAEQEEMNTFIERIEALHTQRILAIGMLAQLRKESVEKISKEFGFLPIKNG